MQIQMDILIGRIYDNYDNYYIKLNPMQKKIEMIRAIKPN